jgi:hypothetical protein
MCAIVCLYVICIGILASLACCDLCVAVSRLHPGVFWLLVFKCVCGCACALVCMQFLCFIFFKCCRIFSGCITCCHMCLASRVCVCAPRKYALWLVIYPCVICLWTCVLWSSVYNFQFLNFVCSSDTKLWIKSKSTIRSKMVRYIVKV